MPTPLQFGPVSIWVGQSSGKYPDGNQVIVKGSDSIAVFDTPLIANALPESAQFDSADLAILGHVHEDHMAGLHRIPDAQVHVHTGDLAAAQSWDGLAAHYGYAPSILEPLHALLVREFHYLPRPGALGYEDGACWDLGGGVRVRAFHMPGHTAGHCVLLVEPGAVAFIGDIELSSFGPYYGDATSNLGDFRRTLTRMVDLPARVWITSHHKGVITDRDEFLRQLAAFSARIDAREERLLSLLTERPKTLAELTHERVVYRPEARELWVESAEALSISRHLEELLSQGRVRREGKHYGLV